MLRVKLTTALAIAIAIWPSGAYAIPDANSPGVPANETSAAQDLRSPDARDAALAPAQSARVSASRSVPSVSDGCEWSDAGIGAAVMLALVTVSCGAVLLVARSRHRARTT